MRHSLRALLFVVLAAACCLATNLRADPEKKQFDQKRRFIDRGDIVEDTLTGLLWQKDGDESGRMNFFEAAEFAKKLKLGGLEGWRVPTRSELAAIFPATDAPFKDTRYNPLPCCKGPGEWHSYWTSELDPRLDDYAWVYQWYDKGGANNCFASRNQCFVRCVRERVQRK
jgi:hypothetical protein